MSRVILSLVALPLTACAAEAPTPSPSQETFAFDNARGATVAVAVRTPDGHVPQHAHVTIRAAPSASPSTSAAPSTSPSAPGLRTAPAVLWAGPVGALGEARGVFTVPEPAPSVDIIVHAPGYQGPCPVDRCGPHGAFAPAAWIRTTVDQVQHTVIALEEVSR